MNDDTSPTILVVEADDQVRPVLSQNLRNHGYQVVVALKKQMRSTAPRAAVYALA